MRVKTSSMIKALPVALATFFAPVAAPAITYDTFTSFFGTPRALKSYNIDGSHNDELFSFPNDGLNQAVRLRPMELPDHVRGFENEYTMDFFDIVGDDLFGQSWRDSIAIHRNDIQACAANEDVSISPQLSVSVSYTDLMRTQTSLAQITDIYASAFAERLQSRTSNYSADELTFMSQNRNAALIEQIILPSMQDTTSYIQGQFNITTQQADTPISISITHNASNISCSFGPAL